MTTRSLIILAVVLMTLYHVSANADRLIVASNALLGGGFYNVTISGKIGYPLMVKILKTDENGVVLFQTVYDDAIEYYDGHKLSVITREGFSFRYSYAFGCYRACQSISLVRSSPPLLATIEYPTCGGICGFNVRE